MAKKRTFTHYQIVREAILERIRTGEYKAGDKIPTEKELIEEFSVSITTIRKAIADLCAEDLLVKQQGRGTFVKRSGKKMGLVFPYSGSSWNAMIEKLRQELIGQNSCLHVYFYDWHNPVSFLEQLDLCETENEGIFIFPPYQHSKNDDLLGRVRDVVKNRVVIFIEDKPLMCKKSTVIAVDYESGFCRLIERLKKSQNKIAVLCDKGHSSYYGLVQACKCNKIPLDLVREDFFSENRSDVVKHVTELLDKKIDALVCPASQLTQQAVFIVKSRNITIPDEIEIAGAGNQTTLAGLMIPMWALQMPREEIAIAAIQCMNAQFRDKQNRQDVSLKPRLVFIDTYPQFDVSGV